MLDGTRREFITVLGVAAARPGAAPAQQTTVRRIGILMTGSTMYRGTT